MISAKWGSRRTRIPYGVRRRLSFGYGRISRNINLKVGVRSFAGKLYSVRSHASPSIDRVDAWYACLLDCDDVTRVDRLRQRGTHGLDMHMLCWAAWMRVHAVDHG